MSGNDNLPRIPPARVGLGMALAAGTYLRECRLHGASSARRMRPSWSSKRTATTTCGRTVGWDVEVGIMSVSVYLRGRNLTDDEQRNHTSVVKDLVPEPGRTIEAGVRIRY